MPKVEEFTYLGILFASEGRKDWEAARVKRAACEELLTPKPGSLFTSPSAFQPSPLVMTLKIIKGNEEEEDPEYQQPSEFLL